MSENARVTNPARHMHDGQLPGGPATMWAIKRRATKCPLSWPLQTTSNRMLGLGMVVQERSALKQGEMLEVK